MMGRVGRERKGNTNMNQELGCGELSPGQEGSAHLRPTGGRLSHESIRYLCVPVSGLSVPVRKAHPDFCKPPVLLTVKVTVRKKKTKTEMEISVMDLLKMPRCQSPGPSCPPAGLLPGPRRPPAAALPFGTCCHKSAVTLPCLHAPAPLQGHRRLFMAAHSILCKVSAPDAGDDKFCFCLTSRVRGAPGRGESNSALYTEG